MLEGPPVRMLEVQTVSFHPFRVRRAVTVVSALALAAGALTVTGAGLASAGASDGKPAGATAGGATITGEGVIGVPITASGQPRLGQRGGPPVPYPQDPHGLPHPVKWGQDIEAYAQYQPQQSCAAQAMSGTVALRNLVLKTYDPGYDLGMMRACYSGGASEHKEGRAWDWGVDVGDRAEQRAAADFLAWITAKGRDGDPGAMARRLGIQYVIYNRKIWSGWNGWVDYTGADPHTSHVHISLSWNGARGHTSFWTGRTWAVDYGTCVSFTGQPAVVASPHPRTSPCPATARSPRGSTQPFAWLGNSGAHVSAAQRLLNVSRTGKFDVRTRAKLLDFQSNHDLPRTGALDKTTWATLQPSTRELKAPRWEPRQAARWARRAGSPVLHRRSAGTAVYALQTALKMPTKLHTGFFGSHTSERLVAFRKTHGLEPSPQTNDRVWTLLSR